MSVSGDAAIKLFGRTIVSVFRADHDPSSSPVSGVKETLSSSSSSSSSLLRADKVKRPRGDGNELDDDSSKKDPWMSRDLNEEPRTGSQTSSPGISKNNKGEPHSEITATTSGTSQDRVPMKKPDKILPCPRCHSSDTKFCYYNNYNLSQPRHFCKNCQRYWTAGGSMRNVPVGAGRRKNKGWAASSSSIHYNDNIPSATFLNFDRSSVPYCPGDIKKIGKNDQQVSLTPNPNFSPILLYWDSYQRSNETDEESRDDQRRRPNRDNLIDLFRGFESKANSRNLVPETAIAMQANPAAMARFLSFHESNATVTRQD